MYLFIIEYLSCASRPSLACIPSLGVGPRTCVAGEGPPFRGALGCRALGILLRMSVGGAASPQSQVEDVLGFGWGRGWGREGVEGVGGRGERRTVRGRVLGLLCLGRDLVIPNLAPSWMAFEEEAAPLLVPPLSPLFFAPSPFFVLSLLRPSFFSTPPPITQSLLFRFPLLLIPFYFLQPSLSFHFTLFFLSFSPSPREP